MDNIIYVSALTLANLQKYVNQYVKQNYWPIESYATTMWYVTVMVKEVENEIV